MTSEKKEPAFPSVCAAGVLVMTREPSPHFLLMRHPDRWDLPKGHCDEGEDFLMAAKRELEEETGIAAEDCEFDPDFQFDLQYPVTYRDRPGQTFQKHVRYFLVFLPQVVKIELTEHEMSRWWPWSPPHQIQSQTIDPLLTAVAEHLAAKRSD
ncbi:Bis(5'-nucleosyl)-tetraphosphatase [Asymmetrical] [Rhodopirellula islandica]|uniref:Bis(5'-nucleosyl)-tetraphosphatase [asymmetrical] n=1 Tax=Rhodopirellula islandica TaxID=595434 RepID=A0A0J1B932_RHOIS|nr:NUDIX domain-containing protein [Rhodopirellula islandica]KLU03038.1 Bis(5'-nucleosyl)-tetraphosphatase [Asymmetrical] [Rhodopirellula islandica]